MLLFKSPSFSVAKEINQQNKKCATFVLENITENSSILMQGEAVLLEKRSKFKSNLFGSIFEFKRLCNSSGLHHCLSVIK
jgi:hypothetical protein